jgi:hypothetical protein
MKTVETDGDVSAFLNCVQNARRREDARTVMAMMERVTGCPPRMWGDSIIGFDRYRYKRRDGSEHMFMITGLSPRKAALTLYIMTGFDAYEDQLARLGKVKRSVSCLYTTRLETIDMAVLEEMVADSVAVMRRRYHGMGDGA